MLEQLRSPPVRAVAIVLAVFVAGYFIWAAWTDAPTSKAAWVAFAALQFLNAGIMFADRRNRDRED
jgi:hypothetical protein